MTPRRLSALAHLLALTACASSDDHAPPAVVSADPEHPGPVRFAGGGGHCCWANYMISTTTHNEDCGGVTPGAGERKGGA
jgi:hypothetical protein